MIKLPSASVMTRQTRARQWELRRVCHLSSLTLTSAAMQTMLLAMFPFKDLTLTPSLGANALALVTTLRSAMFTITEEK
ncbi:hypothetical protein [Octadecabacter arcticus]|uniref:hypothetical protein n=1 Tax=Octadecabacter arcticus TaxID=53946 RepID=UPI001181AD2D|nr:hypothetical protein [Octadecabacter arcticus]